MATVNSGGVDIAYEVLNPDAAGLPIVFISGLGGLRAHVATQSGPFSRERTVVVLDHRGTGESAKPLGVYTLENMASDVIAVLDDAGIAKAHVCGFSTGGAIVQLLCIDHGDRIQSGAICCSWPKSDHFFKRSFEMRKQILLELGTEAAVRSASVVLNDPRYFTLNYDQILAREEMGIANAGPKEVDAERMDAIMAHDQWDRLGSIGVPTLVVCARNDAVTPPYYSEQLAELIPNTRLELFEDGGHFFFQVHADRFNALIRDFIAAHE